ncbi:MAG: efflux RND transporter periplasmic adaptor subunit [Candidatus Stahlbacteria bacterium]|nr:efflux RND transporter periplasmic adaptor subunit [Candidatus Stahlbacteria bacterium]
MRFDFVRRFLQIIILIFICFIGIGIGFIFIFKCDVTVDAVGIIQPQDLTIVRAERPGIICEIFVKEGEFVKKGQLLIKLDNSEALYTLRKLEKELSIANLSFTIAKSTLERTISLYELSSSVYKNLISIKEDTTANSIYEIAVKHAEELACKKRIEQIQDEIKTVQDNLIKTEIHSPVDGMVLTGELNQLKGKYVGVGEDILVLATTELWVVKAIIPEKHISKIKIGDVAKVMLEAYPEYGTFTGYVEEIPILPLTRDGIPVYSTTIKLKSVDLNSYKYGLRAKVKIIMKRGRIVSIIIDKLHKARGQVDKSSLHF